MSKPIRKDITWKETEAFLQGQGYKKIECEGSRKKFYNEKINDMLHIHKPHPGNELKIYQVKEIQNKIKEN